MYTTNRVIIFLALLIGFILSACSYDDIVMDIVQEQKDVQRTQYIQTSYEKAYAKMLALYPSTFATGKRMSAGMPIVDNSYPLWYSDTALVTPDTNPFGPDQPEPGDEDVPTAANDSIYAYVFDFANEQGSMVVSVDENLPDLLAYSKGRNFLKNPYIKYTPKPDANAWEAYIGEKYLYLYERREAMIREFLASLSKATTGEIRDLKVKIEKMYQAQLSADGSHPVLDSVKTIRDWYVDFPSQYPQEGMVPVHWLNILPFTGEIEIVYGSDAYCWDIVPTLAMYFATLQANVYSDNGWTIDWESLLNPESEADSTYNMNNISRLYYELGLPANLNVNYYNQKQLIGVKDRVPSVLSKFGISNTGTYESQNIIWAIYDEIDQGRPAIGFVKGLFKSHDSEVLSFLADDYEIRSQESMYYFHGQLPAKKRFDEIYVSVKFSNFDSQSLIPDFFINWALFNPNYSSYLKALGHSLSVTVPVAKKQYDEMYILKTVQ